jgi:hypothetical protein
MSPQLPQTEKSFCRTEASFYTRIYQPWVCTCNCSFNAAVSKMQGLLSAFLAFSQTSSSQLYLVGMSFICSHDLDFKVTGEWLGSSRPKCFFLHSFPDPHWVRTTPWLCGGHRFHKEPRNIQELFLSSWGN